MSFWHDPPTTETEREHDRIARAWSAAVAGPNARDELHCYSATAFPAGAPAVDGMAVSLRYGPGVAFIPFTSIKGDENAQQIRVLIAANIPGHTHSGTFKATEEQKAVALSILAAFAVSS